MTGACEHAGMRMKFLLGALIVGIVLVSQPTAAAPWDLRPRLQDRDQRMPPRKGPGQREMQRERRMAPERDVQRERRMAPEQDERSKGRLTEDERRELRRDVDRANREIYRRRFER